MLLHNAAAHHQFPSIFRRNILKLTGNDRSELENEDNELGLQEEKITISELLT